MAKKILIAEREKEYSSRYKGLAVMQGLDYEIVSDGEDARKLLKDNSLGFALISRDLPESLLSALTANQNGIPFAITYNPEPTLPALTPLDRFKEYKPVAFYEKTRIIDIKKLMRSWTLSEPIKNCFNCDGKIKECAFYTHTDNGLCSYRITAESDLKNLEEEGDGITLVAMLIDHLRKNQDPRIEKLNRFMKRFKEAK